MPEPFGVTIGIAGIILIGLIFTAINLVKDAGRFIGLGLLGFVLLVLLNRTMSPSGNLTNPGSNPNYPNPNIPISPSPYTTYPDPTFTYPNSNNSPNPNPDASTSPTQRSPSFSFDSVSKGISDFAKSVSEGLDRFVYGDPNAVEPPPDRQADGRTEPESSQVELPPEQQGYQIRPDGVPSRVSTLVVPDSPSSARAPNAATAGAGGAGANRPVSAWW
ncbi:MAG: hypothetical protein KME15_05770 [Drouetiella hepatica Uher 2000/2452]|jgi:hypothetical protein|uniref:Uncharacterized protein n=1 Tax=Drouetiella hepatica Uher 2000/2452 TaxID=904376 RepID=A0A951UKZ5_9CYAN|nr:hypothetical protein [Drouetiella hepatica Uher 2000/2452]